MTPAAVFIQRKMPVWKKGQSSDFSVALFSQIVDLNNLIHLKWPSKSLIAPQIENSSCIVLKVLCWTSVDKNTILFGTKLKYQQSAGYFIYSEQLDTLSCMLKFWLRDTHTLLTSSPARLTPLGPSLISGSEGPLQPEAEDLPDELPYLNPSGARKLERFP